MGFKRAGWNAWILVSLSTIAYFLPQSSFASTESKSKIETILTNYKRAVDHLEDYSVTHTQQERFKDQLGPRIKMKVKISKDRLYAHIVEGPKKGAELIYRPNWNEGKVRVHKGSFPDLTLNLDPHGSRMMDEQHHPVEHLSFKHIAKTVFDSIDNCRNFPESWARIVSVDATGSQTGVLQVELNAPWKTRSETFLPGEDIWSFSRRVRTDPYLILYSNRLEYGDGPDDGASLRVPICYSPRTLLSLDAQTFLPRKLENYDERGLLYESYEWSELNTKPGFTDLDFDPDNKQYEF